MKEKIKNKIDFVITWVDGADEEWLNEKSKYTKSNISIDDAKNRYRDMGTLKYWFRSVEKYAPWVNKIYFITWGHLPEWLDKTNPKLVIVNHKDYIPKEILPVFNTNPIVMHMHKIEGLSEQFVYFNDDFFIGKKVKPTDFFKDGKPRDSLIFNAISYSGRDNVFCGILSNNLKLISTKFNKKDVVRNNFWKIYNLKYGKELLRTFCLMPWPNFTGLYNHHVAISFLKKSFIDVWDEFGEEIEKRTSSRIRSENDVSEWLVRYWQLLTGNFVPNKPNKDKLFDMYKYKTPKKICKAIKAKKYRMFCINDANINIDFENYMNKIIGAFEKVLPEKSSFEK